MPAIISQSIAPRIRRLLSADTFARSSAGSLRPSEVKLLAAVARGERATEGLSRHRAIRALAAAGSPQAAIPVLEQLASNREAQRTNRVAAVRGLGRIATPDAQEFLLRHTDETDPRVQQAAFAALGLFAGRSALDMM
jgi:HEAT repeat protein